MKWSTWPGPKTGSSAMHDARLLDERHAVMGCGCHRGSLRSRGTANLNNECLHTAAERFSSAFAFLFYTFDAGQTQASFNDFEGACCPLVAEFEDVICQLVSL